MEITIRNSPPHVRAPFPLKTVAAAAALIVSSPLGLAADWTFSPKVTLRETYTDNISLTPGPTSSDFITEVIPTLAIQAKGRRLNVDAELSRQEILYARDDRGTRFANQLRADARSELIDGLLFINGAATVGQQTISPGGPQPLDNVHLTNNQTEVRTYNVSPYLTHAFGNTAKAELRYTYASVGASASGLDAAKSDTVMLRVDSGPAFHTFDWGVRYDEQSQHYDTGPTVNLKSVTTALGYRIAPRVHLVASAGYDQNNYPSLGQATEGSFWTAGGTWTVSSRTNVSASVGHRYWGNTASLNASTRSRYALWNLSYEQSVTTTQQQLGLPATTDVPGYLDSILSGSISDPAQRAQAINTLIDSAGLPRSLTAPTNFFTNSVFLQKQLLGSSIFTTPRSTLALSVFNTRRTPLSTPLGSAGSSMGENRQWGGSAILSRRLTSQTSANLSVLATKLKTSDGTPDSRNTSLTTGLSKQFSRKIRGNVEVRHTQYDYSLPGLSYRENAIMTFLNVAL